MRFVIKDAATLREMTAEIGRLLDDGVEVGVPDFVAEEYGELPAGVVVVETMLGSRQRNAWELWRRAGRPEDLRPVELTDDDRAWAIGKLLRNPAAG